MSQKMRALRGFLQILRVGNSASTNSVYSLIFWHGMDMEVNHVCSSHLYLIYLVADDASLLDFTGEFINSTSRMLYSSLPVICWDVYMARCAVFYIL